MKTTSLFNVNSRSYIIQNFIFTDLGKMIDYKSNYNTDIETILTLQVDMFTVH